MRHRDTGFYWTLTVLFWIALIFAVLPDGLSWTRVGAEVTAQQGSLIRRLQWLPLFGTAAYVIWIRRDVCMGLARHINPFLILFLVWIGLSVLWSGFPSVTLRKVVILGGFSAIALAFQAASWQPGRMRRLVRAGVTALLVASLLTALLLPDYGREASLNAWVGVTRSKNHLGLLAGFGVLLWLHAYAIREVPFGRALCGALFCLGMLLMARSATSLVGAVAMMPVLWILLRPPLSIPNVWSVGLLAFVALFASLAFGYLMILGVPTWQDLVRPVAGAVGRDVTLTGRLQIWQLMMQEVSNHPWLGTGYGAFWLGADGPAPWVTQNLYGILWQAHDGYIDVLNETGIIGLLLVGALLAFHLWQTAALLRHDRANAVFHAMFIGYFMLSNISESSLFRPINFLFFMSIMTSLDLSRAHANIALRRRIAHKTTAAADTPGMQGFAR
ncbi:O-antigen ligase family protein [Salinisphaera aquimarina]|uniref:O-antigen ligase family protein n=1 Tax=Salinisphaera aquimarina TaxID=2094031 RepID=A0ABV7ESX0_9GAMM